ncbi:MAG: glycosyltransferase [Planctomycetota bacterium]
MKITVAICTWNRARLLDQTLRSLSNLEVSQGIEWEILVVNNNCTDETDAVIARHGNAIPLRRLFEPRAGLSNARNCAAAAATGELLLYIDDDVLIGTTWLTAYKDAAESLPDASFFGGPIEPCFENLPPAWIRRNMHVFGTIWGALDLGPEIRPFSSGESPFGANMGFRIHLVREFLFNPRLGYSGTGKVAGEEGELVMRAMNAAHVGYWIPTARLRHCMPSDRLTKRHLWDTFYGRGRAEAHLGDWRDCPQLFGVPRYLIRRYYQGVLEKIVFLPTRGARWAKAFRNAASAKGFIDELRRPIRSTHE